MIENIKALRTETGLSIADCKKALVASNNSIDNAIVWLRENGMKRQKKVDGRACGEGAITYQTGIGYGVLSELVCETDFVARNPEFERFHQNILSEFGKYPLKDVLNESNLLTDFVAKMGENVHFRNVTRVEAPFVAGYTHTGNKLGAMVGFTKNLDPEIAKDFCMQVVANAPKYLDKASVDPKAVTVEKELAEKSLNPKVPADKREMIIEGVLAKYYREVCLLEQPFIKDAKKTVAEVLKENDASITEFVRFQVGK